MDDNEDWLSQPTLQTNSEATRMSVPAARRRQGRGEKKEEDLSLVINQDIKMDKKGQLQLGLQNENLNLSIPTKSIVEKDISNIENEKQADKNNDSWTQDEKPKRGNRNNRDTQNQNQHGEAERKPRGNRQFNHHQRGEPQTQGRQDRQDRGWRQDRGRGNNFEDNQNRPYRNYNRDYNNRNENQGGGDNERYQRNFNRDYNNRNGGDNERFQRNRERYNNVPYNANEKPKQGQVKEKNQQLELSIPKGRKAWPQSSIYIIGCRLVITFRDVTDLKGRLLIIPYETTKMEYYPGNIINKSSVDYRSKIKSKGPQISTPGKIYPQKAVDIKQFQALGFLKVSKQHLHESFLEGIKSAVEFSASVKSEKPNTIIFPLSEELGDVKPILKAFIQNLSEHNHTKKIKEVYLATIQKKCFQAAIKAYSEAMCELIEMNEICTTSQ